MNAVVAGLIGTAQNEKMSILSLILYFGFVAVAIVGLWDLQGRLGLSKTPDLSKEEAEGFWRSKFPDLQIAEATPIEGGYLFRMQNENIGWVRMMGRFPVARLFDQLEVRSAARDQEDILLHLNDYAEPVVRLTPISGNSFPSWVTDRLLPKTVQNS